MARASVVKRHMRHLATLERRLADVRSAIPQVPPSRVARLAAYREEESALLWALHHVSAALKKTGANPLAPGARVIGLAARTDQLEPPMPPTASPALKPRSPRVAERHNPPCPPGVMGAERVVFETVIGPAIPRRVVEDPPPRGRDSSRT